MARVKLRSTEEREAAGKALRQKCPRASHGKVILGQGPDRDIVKLIKASNHDRLENLVPIRHGRMAQSPFAFFRGTAALQAYDLAGTPASGIVAQTCGDCHLMNFGGFATPERTLAFDINDFDETLPAPFEWDLKRLAASFVVAARWRGFEADAAREAVLQVVGSYRESMKERSGTGALEAWYSQITAKDVQKMADELGTAQAERTKAAIDKAYKQTHERVFQKLTTPTKGGLPRIADQPPLIYHAEKKVISEEVIRKFFKRYRDTLPEERRMLFDRYEVIDVAMKVVGVGSVGTRCYIALLMSAPDDPLFLQVKEARRSVLEPYVRLPAPEHNGQRVVVGQRLMQSASDIFLGWSKASGKSIDFYVRQLRDMKAAAHIEIIEPEGLVGYAKLCGLVLARAHDKAGDAAVIAGYLGNKDTFDQALADYAIGYADQVERDYETFVKAIRTGKLPTDTLPGETEVAIR